MHHHHDHDHGHHHHHHHASPADIGNKAFVWGIMLNGAYVTAQIIAGFMTNSVALLSDAGHNLGDVAGLALSLIALRLAKVKPNGDFTYGYKKATVLAALANAVLLLLAIGVLGYESVSRIWHPKPVEGSTVAWVAGLGILVNGISAFFFFRNKDKELNNKAAYLHLLSDALVSLGVVVAGIIIHYTHWYWLDAVVGISVLLVILVSTWSLLTSSLRLTLDAVPEGVDADEIADVMMKVKGVENIHHMHIWAMSTMENALTSHVVLDSSLDFDKKMQVVHNIKHALQHHKISHATIELESADKPCHDADC